MRRLRRGPAFGIAHVGQPLDFMAVTIIDDKVDLRVDAVPAEGLERRAAEIGDDGRTGTGVDDAALLLEALVLLDHFLANLAAHEASHGGRHITPQVDNTDERKVGTGAERIEREGHLTRGILEVGVGVEHDREVARAVDRDRVAVDVLALDGGAGLDYEGSGDGQNKQNSTASEAKGRSMHKG